MMDTNEKDSKEKKQPDQSQEQEKLSGWGEPPFNTADPLPEHEDGTTGEPVPNEKKPARQMTGGPDKPTA